MPYYSKQEFLDMGIKRSTTDDPICNICYELFPVDQPQHRPGAYFKDTCSASKALLSRPSKTGPRFPARAKTRRASKRQNTMVEIIACGHQLCLSCLDRWLVERITCPMCRDVLVIQDERSSYFFGDPRPFSEREILEIRDMGAPAVSGLVSRGELDLEEGRQDAWWQVFGGVERRERWWADVIREGDVRAGWSDAWTMEESDLDVIGGLKWTLSQDEEEDDDRESENGDYEEKVEGMARLSDNARNWAGVDEIAHLA
ncbi:uncharacterized protein K460DRAFT_366344 [Cucurbitaria berberidis CBS 394.84]|uniref:RING-type domain-containing protein n=1 Tax=Cucurbitaria berberidis CBS 394.84 TaxID=1168544 RepID=A0A9P4L8R3_9PLEO|nr:uncharacterized protein K460DRAFT_366344 [Cucurbitaria berberidis CBS 394.84]KAF1845464.1 hypothetical protein K460DRAFT_366344 [Cucurbitaria berberidis CBS 394.84]